MVGHEAKRRFLAMVSADRELGYDVAPEARLSEQPHSACANTLTNRDNLSFARDEDAMADLNRVDEMELVQTEQVFASRATASLPR